MAVEGVLVLAEEVAVVASHQVVDIDQVKPRDLWVKSNSHYLRTSVIEPFSEQKNNGKTYVARNEISIS